MLLSKKVSRFALTLTTFSFLVFAIFALSSCNKEEMAPMEASVEEAITETTASSRSKNDCLEGVRSEKGVLVFENTEHFTNVYKCLKETYEQNIAEFTRPLENMEDEEEIIALAIKKEFNTEKPLLDFEATNRRFISLRKSLEEKEQEWLASDSLFEKEDPYFDLPVDKILATMLNPKMEVMIGEKVVTASGEVTGRSSCYSGFSKSGTRYCSSKKRFRGKQFLVNIFGTSYVGGTTIAHRKVFRRWWPALLTRVYAHKYGYVYKTNCEKIKYIQNNITYGNFYTANIQNLGENTRIKPGYQHVRTRHWTNWCSNVLELRN